VIVVSLAVNLTAMTIEEVVSKRRKIIVQICDEMVMSTKQATRGEAWQELRQLDVYESPATVAERCLLQLRSRIMDKSPDYFNVNKNLVNETGAVLGVADAVEAWGDGLYNLHAEWCAMNKESIPLDMLLREESFEMVGRWKEADVIGAYGLAALVSLSTCLTELIVNNNNLGDVGVAAIAAALGINEHSTVTRLSLSRTHAGERAGKALVAMLEGGSAPLEFLDVRGNPELVGDAKSNLEHACKMRQPPVRLIID